MPVSRAKVTTAITATSKTAKNTKIMPALRLFLPFARASSFLSRLISVGISLCLGASSTCLLFLLSGSAGRSGMAVASLGLPVRSSGSISARSLNVTPFCGAGTGSCIKSLVTAPSEASSTSEPVFCPVTAGVRAFLLSLALLLFLFLPFINKIPLL